MLSSALFSLSPSFMRVYFYFVSQTKQWTMWIPHYTIPATWHTLWNACRMPIWWVSYKPLDIWVPSSKEGSEIRDMDLGVISQWKQFPLNWWSHSPRRWKCFFNSTLKDSTKKKQQKTPYIYYAPSTSHVFSLDAFYLPRKAGGGIHSFSFFFSLSTGFFSAQVKGFSH